MTPTAAIFAFLDFFPGPRRFFGDPLFFAWPTRPFLCGCARLPYSPLEIVGAPLPSTVMSRTSVSSSGTTACSRNGRASLPIASTIRSTDRGAGAQPSRSRRICRVGRNAIIAANFATSVISGSVKFPGKPRARVIGRSRGRRTRPTTRPTGRHIAILANFVPTSTVSPPSTS